MENSHLIATTNSRNELFAFVHGYGGESGHSPARIAWQLEDLALHRGWPAGACLGLESELLERFAVSRETFREAVRIVEARGSMHMRRGCKGGLHLLSPGVEQVASAFATYLRVSGCSDFELEQTVAIAAPVFAELGEHNVVVRLFHRTLELLARDEQHTRSPAMRGHSIALRLIRQKAPIVDGGVELGSEAELCVALDACRSTVRQALRILHDSGMLEVRRGRGGGYVLKRPSSIGMVRHFFAMLASRQQAVFDLVPIVWALNLINLRMAMCRMRANDDQRTVLCERLSTALDVDSEPQRWAALQQAMSAIAGSTVVSTLQSCVVGYHARLGQPAVAYETIGRHLRADEEGIVASLRTGNDADAERLHRRLQSRLSALFGCADLPSISRIQALQTGGLQCSARGASGNLAST